MLASVSQHRLSPEVSNGSPKAAGGVGGGGGGGSGNGGSNGSSRLIGAYERESWGSLEIVPSVQLKSDSDEVSPTHADITIFCVFSIIPFMILYNCVLDYYAMLLYCTVLPHNNNYDCVVCIGYLNVATTL